MGDAEGRAGKPRGVSTGVEAILGCILCCFLRQPGLILTRGAPCSLTIHHFWSGPPPISRTGLFKGKHDLVGACGNAHVHTVVPPREAFRALMAGKGKVPCSGTILLQVGEEQSRNFWYAFGEDFWANKPFGLAWASEVNTRPGTGERFSGSAAL